MRWCKSSENIMRTPHIVPQHCPLIPIVGLPNLANSPSPKHPSIIKMGTSPHHSKTPPSFFPSKNSMYKLIFLLIPLTFLLHIYFISPSKPNPKLQHQIIDRTYPCDFADGKWVKTERGPLYNGTSCGTIKDNQNCMAHGRPDTGYLFWRWQPNHCNLPQFEPDAFLELMRNKHIAFIGDSLARNQLESLLCLLASAYPPQLVYNIGDDNKFRRWVFGAHNVTVSSYWSPFLVDGVEKEEKVGRIHNTMYLHAVDERWASHLKSIDVVVLSIGHWFLIPAIFQENGKILGCHGCQGLNHTEVEFFDMFKKAIRTSLREVKSRLRGTGKRVFFTTFSPHHFDGEWDKAGACASKEPFEESREMAYMDKEMHRIEVQEVGSTSSESTGVRFDVLDVTRLAMLRGDGHPGPYMYANPFADGFKERVPNDCVHWCMPGPVDTWNEILLEKMMR